MPRRGTVTLLLLVATSLAACSPTAHRPAPTATQPAARTTRPGPDQQTAAALIRIAQAFNDNYDANDDAPVWHRWDALSHPAISRAGYLPRHADCPPAPHG